MMKKALNCGILVSVEGIDCSGKSSLVKSLHASLLKEGWDTILTWEHGDNVIGDEIKAILKKAGQICPKAEYLAFATDRAQHYAEVIRPNLEQKKVIISDRFSDSSLAHQGYGHGLDLDMIKSINNWTTCNTSPNLVLYLKISIQAAKERLMHRGIELTSLEQTHWNFLEKVSSGFDKIFKSRENVIIIDAEQPEAVVAKESKKKLLLWLNKQDLPTR